MPQYGFKFDVKGSIFIAQKSQSGADVVNAFDAAMDARKKILDVLTTMPVEALGLISVSDPVMASRRKPDAGSGDLFEPDGAPDEAAKKKGK